MLAILRMLYYFFSCILHLASFWAFHIKLLAFIFEMTQYLFICEESLIFFAFGVRTAFKSDFHHDVFEFKVCSSEFGFLITCRALIALILIHTPPAIERVTVLTADRVIHNHCAYWTAPLLLGFLLCKLNKLKVFKEFLICGLESMLLKVFLLFHYNIIVFI